MKYKNFDLDKFLNGPNAKPVFTPPAFIYEPLHKPETPESKIVKNLIWSLKFYFIGVGVIVLILAIAFIWSLCTMD